MILICQWYTPSDRRRLTELETARRQNESSGLFSRCLYLDGDSRRWDYGELFEMAASQFRGQVCVVANTDITFDSTAKALPELCRPGRLIALTRWETPHSPRMLGHFADERFFSGTQDAWVFAGGMIKPIAAGVQLGVVGCDNRIVGDAVLRGVEVVNPSLTVRTRHLHADTHRRDRPSVYGKYGYPELCTADSSGDVMCHDWFPSMRMSDVKAEVVHTCPQ